MSTVWQGLLIFVKMINIHEDFAKNGITDAFKTDYTLALENIKSGFVHQGFIIRSLLHCRYFKMIAQKQSTVSFISLSSTRQEAIFGGCGSTLLIPLPVCPQSSSVNPRMFIRLFIWSDTRGVTLSHIVCFIELDCIRKKELPSAPPRARLHWAGFSSYSQRLLSELGMDCMWSIQGHWLVC